MPDLVTNNNETERTVRQTVNRARNLIEDILEKESKRPLVNIFRNQEHVCLESLNIHTFNCTNSW